MLENQKEEAVEQAGPVFNPPVYIQRYTTVRDILYKLPGIKKVVDFGCAEGKFFKYLKKLPFVVEIVGVDLSEDCLEQASYNSRPLAFDFLCKRHYPLSIRIFKGSVSEKDNRLHGFDAVTCIELIEHLEPNALQLLPSNIFGYIRPKVAVFTTPNSEFNVLFPQLKGFRHWDHKFEWNRNEFIDWCNIVIKEYPEYTVEFFGIGDAPSEYSHLGGCTQMAVFKQENATQSHTESVQNNTAEPYVLITESLYPGREEKGNSNFSADAENNSAVPNDYD